MRLLVLTAVLAIAGSAEAQTGGAPAKASASKATVADPQSIRIGKEVVARPFGATLVDQVRVVGTVRGRTTRYHLVRGAAAGECPARYVIVTQPTTGALQVSAPFGTCADGATLRLQAGAPSVAMPDPVSRQIVQFDWVDGRMTSPAAAVARAAADTTPGCVSPYTVSASVEAETIARFERDYPEAYRRGSLLKRTDIAPDQLREVVAGLACLSTWPSGGKVVADTATELFASKRHGARAFAELERLSRDGDAGVYQQAAARSFAAEMRYRVERRSVVRI
ncbi:hypothetical protein KCP91_02690 [Microvirga sp. SRT01]|uniref:DUF4476 domain-containing protein n=1 Tax=Sphingomonas longa TaxID=2778730 RepID=A0ABS2D301_9SPHN|nr:MULTISPECIES: hypothetical protein [Alphaproteobacteria]MBM6575263.1 hypothetical protein [Sphingomonas sp. BT552]MBR7708313.1 hypothetical protein [Microvirga sp. SRT01]